MEIISTLSFIVILSLEGEVEGGKGECHKVSFLTMRSRETEMDETRKAKVRRVRKKEGENDRYELKCVVGRCMCAVV